MPNTRHRFLSAVPRSLLIAVAAALAACSSAPPAPIVARTVPGSAGTVARTTPGLPPVAPVTSPAPLAAPVVPPPSAVQAAPLRPSTIESRALDSRPLPPTGSTTPQGAAPSGASATPPLSTVRAEPRGTKVPYSDAAASDMRAADSASNTASNTARPASAAAAPAAVATAPRAAEPTRSTEAASSGPLEWSWPVNGRVVQGFAETSKGIALGGSSGDSVLAAADGKVIFSGNGPRGYGNLVIVKHANDMLSVYAHNRSLAVKEGQVVKKGQKVAELGDTGGSSPRLHFEIRQQGKPVDPLTVLPKR